MFNFAAAQFKVSAAKNNAIIGLGCMPSPLHDICDQESSVALLYGLEYVVPLLHKLRVHLAEIVHN